MSTTNSLFARIFARIGPRMDRRGADAHRRELVDGLAGDVLEIGAGYGASFPFYPPDVRSLLALEPDTGLRDRAEATAAASPLAIRVSDGRAEHIPLPDSSVDAVVFSLVLCSVEEQSAALAEAARVLKPSGILAFYEHVRSSGRMAGLVEDIATPAWRRVAGNCHPNRDTVASIAAAGFQVQKVRRFGFSVLPAIPPATLRLRTTGRSITGSILMKLRRGSSTLKRLCLWTRMST